MYLREDANCCTLIWLLNFGEKQPVNDPGGLFTQEACAKDFEHFVERLQYKINNWNKEKDPEVIGRMPFEYRALICATTCSAQPLAEGYLKTFGFDRQGPFEKKKHDHTTLSLWTLYIPTFVEKLRKWDEKFGLNPARTTPTMKSDFSGTIIIQTVPAYLDGRLSNG